MNTAKPFELSPDAITGVPSFKLNSNTSMPAIGLGTFGSDNYSAEVIAGAVKGAISVGYRHIDCASVYQNEKEIGAALSEVFASGLVKREELFITSKLWNDMHGDGDALVSLAQSLRDLRLEYLDLYLVHWPFPNYHAPHCDGDARNPDSRPFFIDEFMRVWHQLERMVDMGLVKAIGTSNVTKAKMEQIWPLARIKPAVNEMEIHPHFKQAELRDYLLRLSCLPIGFSPLGSPGRPERDRTPEDTNALTDPTIRDIAEAHGIHPALVCLKWGVQSGHAIIPFSVKPEQYKSNLACITQEPLSEDELKRIDAIEAECRLIKGQVFLWPGAVSWRNLWDEDGVVDLTGFGG